MTVEIVTCRAPRREGEPAGYTYEIRDERGGVVARGWSAGKRSDANGAARGICQQKGWTVVATRAARASGR